jgi:hypothetical protein
MNGENSVATETTGANASAERPVARTRNVDIVVSLLILALAILFGWDAYRIGASWSDDGPQAGYFPFYLSIIMGGGAIYGLVAAIREKSRASFVTREQFSRVLQVFVPTVVFCILTQFLGLYVASFLLVGGFMWWIGDIAAWKSILVAFVFTIVMFLTFEVAFNVIMPKGPLEAAFGF